MEKHANDNTHGAANPAGEPLRYLSVCSGIEAATVAWHGLGWQAAAYSEIEKFPAAVLAHHYPNVPNLGDFTKVDTTTLGRIDILAGGTPCQAFSVAGSRGSLGDARGNLTLTFVRLAHELANGNGLRNAVWENVPGVLSTKDNAFGCFLGALVGAGDAVPPPHGTKWPSHGMVAGPKGRAAWCVKDAQYFGLAQRRRRVLVVADFGAGADPAAVLFERQSLHGNPAPSRKAREDVAGTVAGGARGRGGYSYDDVPLVSAPLLGKGNCSHDDSKETYIPSAVAYAPELARCDATREGSSQDYETTTMVAQCVTGQITHTLKAEGADASEDGTGRGTPIVCFSAKDYGADAAEEQSPTLRAGGGRHANEGVMPAIAFAIQERAVSENLQNGPQGKGYQPEIGYTLEARNKVQSVATTSAVRRLTPVECERLQGFKDNYTAIPWRGKPASECPDGPRYKALGNSWAVPKFAWLGRRIAALMPASANDNTTARQDAA